MTLEDVLEIVAKETAARRHRPVRRPDAAQAGARPRAGRRADHRHDARLDRHRRGPRALPEAAPRARPAASRPTARRAPRSRRSRWRRRSATRLSSGRATCSAAGRWRSCTATSDLERYMREAVKVSEKSPVLLDRFLDDAIEVDVDCISDGAEVMIGGIMEHVEQAGIHSGDSACSLPPYSLPARLQDELRRQTATDGRGRSSVVGLMNVQFAIQGDVDRFGDADGRDDLRARGQPARVADRALRLQGDRRAARQDRGALHGRPVARGADGSSRRGRSRRTSRSRKRSSRSTSFPASIRCSGPRCARPAR